MCCSLSSILFIVILVEGKDALPKNLWGDFRDVKNYCSPPHHVYINFRYWKDGYFWTVVLHIVGAIDLQKIGVFATAVVKKYQY